MVDLAPGPVAAGPGGTHRPQAISRARIERIRRPCDAWAAVLATPPIAPGLPAPRPEDSLMTTTNGGAAGAAAARGQCGAPQLNVLAQYVKDLSFENPNAPRSLQQQQQAAADQHPDQRQRQAAGRATTTRSSSRSRAGPRCRAPVPVQLRPALCRRVPHRERAAGQPARDHHDRVPAAAVPVRARADRDRGAQWRLPAADDRSGGFRVALPPEDRREPAAAGCPRLRRAGPTAGASAR